MGSAERGVSIVTGAAIKLLLDVGQEAEMTRPGGDLMTMELSRLGQQVQAALGRDSDLDDVREIERERACATSTRI